MCAITPWSRWRAFALIAAIVLLAACATAPAVSRPTATSGPLYALEATPIAPLPAFSDWRLALIGQDGRLHIISLDSKSDYAGVGMPTATGGTGAWTASTAPDGQRLAYSDTAEVVYLDLSASHVPPFQTFHLSGDAAAGYLSWSPDDQRIVVDGGLGNIHIITLATGAVVAVPVPTRPQGSATTSEVGAVYGWLDNTHLAVDYLPGELAPVTTPTRSGAPQIAANLDSLNITSGALRPVVTIRSTTMSSGSFSLAPDAREALFYDTYLTGEAATLPVDQFQPMADRVDLSTGAVTPLPHITSLISRTNHVYDTIYQVLWLPHTHRALVTLAGGDQVAGNDIIDLDTDSVTPIQLSSFPVAWSPDGKALILSSAPGMATAKAALALPAMAPSPSSPSPPSASTPAGM